MMDFEFNLGEFNLSQAQPQDNTLYASLSGSMAQVSNEEVIFMPADGLNNQVMTMDVMHAMSLTSHFLPLHAHVQQIEQMIPKLKNQRGAIQSVLELLKKNRLLLSESDWLEHLLSDVKERQVPSAGVVIRTCNRPDCLTRILESLATYQEKFKRNDAILVFDDSADPAMQEKNRKVCVSQKNLRIQHFGESWQNQFIGMLKEAFPQHAEAVDWLLAERDEFSAGRVWNFALLSLAGKKFAFYDDDYLIQPRAVSHPHAEWLDLSDAVDLQVEFGLNVRDIKNQCEESEVDVLGEMLDACGQSFGQWLRGRSLQQIESLQGQSIFEMQRLESNGVIKTTGNGTWGSPRAQSNYWLYFLKGTQRESFWKDRETYLSNIEAAHLLHYSPQWQALSMTRFAPSAIDNSALTPFSMPVNKNEDHFFNALMLFCYPQQVSLHHPVMMGHIQDSARKRSQMNHLAMRPNFNKFVADFLLTQLDSCHSQEPTVRMQAMAQVLHELMTASDAFLIQTMNQYITKVRADLVAALQAEFIAAEDAPIYWKADVKELIEANGKALVGQTLPRLSDWPDEWDDARCLECLRQDVQPIAQALEVWPQLWAFCASK